MKSIAMVGACQVDPDGKMNRGLTEPRLIQERIASGIEWGIFVFFGHVLCGIALVYIFHGVIRFIDSDLRCFSI
jgi:hypothetical protein